MTTTYTSKGEEVVTDYTTGDAAAPANYYIGWGTGSGGGKASTDLVTPSAESRVAGAETQPLADKAQWVATITAEGAQTITEAGLFDALTGGNLLIYGDFTGIALAIGDKIEFTITLQQT